jgi:hypothetical protein
MNRRLALRRTCVGICFFACLVGLSLGASCPAGGSGDPLNPSVPYGNRPPRVIITGVRTPESTAYEAQVGDLVSIDFTGEDGEDVAAVRVFASTAANPLPAQEIPIMAGFTFGPGVGSGTAAWNTAGLAEGGYNIFAEIDDRTFDPATGQGNPAVRVTASQSVQLVPPAPAGEEDPPPTVQVDLPSTDAGVTDGDILTIGYQVRDSKSDVNTLTITYYFDTERNASSPTNVSVQVGQDTVAAGTTPVATFYPVLAQVTIDLTLIPIRRDTDQGGRPLPYFVRVHADNGNGGTVDEYAAGAVRLLSPALDVVDLLQDGSSVAGATWQGFYGHPTDQSRGSRAGSAFTSVGDMDEDGLDDFVIVAERASPNDNAGVGELYLVYGRQRNVDTSSANYQYVQGRYAGVIPLNTVGTFVPFPPGDVLYHRVFNIRGTIFDPPGVRQPPFGRGTLGITSVARMPNVTDLYSTETDRDTTPELLIGSPYNDSIIDQEDDDPCDKCAFDAADVPAFTCFTDMSAEPLQKNIEGLSGALAAGTYSYLMDFTLGKKRIYSISSFAVHLKGEGPEGLTGAEGNFNVEFRLENANGPSKSLLVNLADCTPGAGDPPGPCTGGGQFDVTLFFDLSDPEFPVAEGEGIPPSVYDGAFRLIFTHDSGQTVTFDIADVIIGGITVMPEDHQIRFAYYSDDYPHPYSNASGCSSLTPAPADPFDLQDVTPACPPMNRARNPMADPRGSYPDGLLCEDIGFLLGAVDGGTNDDLYSGEPFGPFYQTGHVFMAAGNDITLRLDQGIYTGSGFRVAPIRSFGQPAYLREGGGGLRGARFRGAWYQPDGLYDPSSLFGYTVDVMPDMDTWGTTPVELIASAPASGSYGVFGPVDLSPLNGAYPDASVDPVVTARTAPYDFGVSFGKVSNAVVVLTGSATNLARLRVSVNDPNGLPISGTSREMLLWNGASLSIDPDVAPVLAYAQFFGPPSPYAVTFDGQSEASPALVMPLPQAALPYLASGAGTLTLEIVDECVIKSSGVQITSALILVDGLARNYGLVNVMEGYDYSSVQAENVSCGGTNGEIESGESRPMSWPSTYCTADEPPGRGWCNPSSIVVYSGERYGDALGWGHYAGDVDNDSVPDIIFGAPLADSNPVAPVIDPAQCSMDSTLEPDSLTDNGKVYLIYGNVALGSGPQAVLPCSDERFEIRGSHDDDQFGRVQGLAGDMNDDGVDDVFVAAEGYDAVGDPVNPSNPAEGTMPIIGADAGFVGVLFGGTLGLDGQVAVNAERVGTPNYPGSKFVGGMAGARLGGGTPSQVLIPGDLAASEDIFARGQHGAASAGDFNGDGVNDLLMTAPGQTWPGAKIEFKGSVVDGSTVTINGKIFEFDINGHVSAGRIAVTSTSLSAAAAEAALVTAIAKLPAETINVAALKSQTDFPAPLPDYPTISFLSRTATGFGVSSSSSNVVVTQFTRLGVAYLVFGSNTLLTNKTFVLPNDMNRRGSDGKRVLKGIVFVSGYDQGTEDEAPVEAVAGIGDIDGDGFADIILGAPTADTINILDPTQRRQSAGEAYLIYGSQFGLNSTSAP